MIRFKALDDFLHHAARASLYLWPAERNKPPKKEKALAEYRARQQRGKHLREHLGLAEDDPLRQRELRDNLQHLDERIDEWIVHHPPPAEYGDLLIDCYINDQR